MIVAAISMLAYGSIVGLLIEGIGMDGWDAHQVGVMAMAAILGVGLAIVLHQHGILDQLGRLMVDDDDD